MQFDCEQRAAYRSVEVGSVTPWRSQLNLVHHVTLASLGHSGLKKQSKTWVRSNLEKRNPTMYLNQKGFNAGKWGHGGWKWNSEKPLGDHGATQRLATAGSCCHTLAGETEGRRRGTRTHGAGILEGFWDHTVGFGAMDPEDTLPVLRDHSVTALLISLKWWDLHTHSSFNPVAVALWVSCWLPST